MKSPIHFYITDKILILTQNKVASRYTSFLLYPYSIDTNFYINSNFEIFDNNIDLYNNPKNIKIEYVIDEFNSIFNKKTNKNILFLYRNPFDRIFSGIIQEFYTTLYDTINEYYDFKLKFILDNHYNCASLYYKLLSNKLWYTGGFDNSNNFFTEYEIKVLSKLLLEYIVHFSNTKINHTDNTYDYLKLLYNTIFDESKVDKDKVTIIDITNDINLIPSYCKLYHDLQDDVPTNTNNFMKHILSTDYLDLESFNLLNDSLEKIKNLISEESYYYNKLIESNLNYKIK